MSWCRTEIGRKKACWLHDNWSLVVKQSHSLHVGCWQVSTDEPQTAWLSETVASGVSDTSSESNVHLEILNLMAGCVGLTSNSFAVVVLACCKSLRQRIWSILLINQCILDLVASVIIVMYHGTILLRNIGLHAPHSSPMGDLYCKLWSSAVWHWGLMGASSYNLLIITAERYLMLVHPIYHKLNVSRRRLYVTAICPWIIGLSFQLAYGVPTSELRGEHCAAYAVWPGAGVQRLAGVFSTILPFFFPVIVMIILYGKIVLILRAKARVGMTSQVVPNKGITKSQSNLTKTCVIIVAAFICCWGPSQAFWMLYNLGLDISMKDDGHMATLLMIYLNCSVNPFIYTFSFGEFQKGMRRLFHCCSCIKKRAGDQASSIGSDSVTGGNAAYSIRRF